VVVEQRGLFVGRHLGQRLAGKRFVKEPEWLNRLEGSAQQRPLRGLFEAVLDQKVEVIALVEDLALHVRIQLHEPPGLAVLLGDQLLVQRRDLDIEIEGGQVEVGREALRGAPAAVPFDVEGRGLVAPVDLVEVEKLGELTLAVVSEGNALVGK
jgi:hypothetical protein